MMSSWDSTRFEYGHRVVNSVGTTLKQKVQEREEIEMLTAQYLLTKKIQEIPYGVRSNKVEFENSDFKI